MNNYTKSAEKYTKMGGEMKEDKYITLKEVIKMYYGEVTLTEAEEEEVDACLREMEENGFLEKCKEIARQSQKERERKCVRIGRWWINKVACLIITLIVGILGVTTYAAVRSHINSIQITDKENHSEIKVEYNDGDSTLSAIEDYYAPNWIPDGYYLSSENKFELEYDIVYTNNQGDRILYDQYLPTLKSHYSTENYLKEKVEFDEYSGWYVETDPEKYLIVTDGTYLYSLIDTTGNIDKQDLIKMLKIK